MFTSTLNFPLLVLFVCIALRSKSNCCISKHCLTAGDYINHLSKIKSWLVISVDSYFHICLFALEYKCMILLSSFFSPLFVSVFGDGVG